MRDSKQAMYLELFFRSLMKYVCTSIPGHVDSFDPETQLATLIIGISGNDKNTGRFDHAPVIQCPVQFSGGSGWSFEHELNTGDEGIIVFSQRCIDGWVQTGGIADNPIMRFHDMQDAYFIPGIRSKPNVITGFQNNGIRLRNSDASVYHWLKNDGTIESKNGTGTVTISNGSINIQSTGNVTINGVIIDPSSNVTTSTTVNAMQMNASSSLTVASKEMNGHIHSDGSYTANTTKVTGSSGAPI